MTIERTTQVLLVEDNPQDGELTLRAFKKRNLANEVRWVKDGAQALEYVFGASPHEGAPLEHAPSVILLDLKLPKVDGLEVLRTLKGDSRTKSIPVIVLTSSREERDLVESYRLGVNSYIVKPVEFESFLSAVLEIGLYWLLLNEPLKPISVPESNEGWSR